MVWYILLGIVAFLFLICCVPLSLTVALDESGTLRLVGRVLGMTIYRSPKKERPVKLSDYTPRAIRRREKREERRRQKAISKAKRKQKKQESKTQKKQTPQPPDAKMPLIDKITFIKDLAEVVLQRSLKHARVDVESLAITVATPDAARTAILYGSVCAALAGVTEVLNVCSHLRIRDSERYGVAADFAGEKTRVDIKLHFRLRVHHALDIALRALLRLVARMLKKYK